MSRASRLIIPVGAALVLIVWKLVGAPPTAATPKPNIILILTDDQRWDTVDVTHTATPLNPQPVMSNVMTELVSHGITFRNAFVTTALCAPSRASLLTGQYAHTHGVKTNHADDFEVQQSLEPQLLPVWMQTAGYRTAYFGKYSNNYVGNYVPEGWHEWHALQGQGGYSNFVIWQKREDAALNPVNFECALTPPGPLCAPPQQTCPYSTDELASRSLAFIQGWVDEDEEVRPPFFLVFAPKAPHGEGGEPEPAWEDIGCFEGVDPWRPFPKYDEDVADKPSWLSGRLPLSDADKTRIERRRKRSLESLQAVDRAVSALIDKLRDPDGDPATPGVDENTVIIYTSDNGYFWGEHRLEGKKAPYDEAIRVPLVIRPAPPLASPRPEDGLVLNIDVTRTIAELAQATPKLRPEGRSLVPLINGTPLDVPWRTAFVVEHFENPNPLSEPTTFAGLGRRKNRKYVEHGTNELELYRFLEDPGEVNNEALSFPTIVTAACLRELNPRWPLPADPNRIFASSFECDDLAAWSDARTYGGRLRIDAGASLTGINLGLKVMVESDPSNQSNPRYVQDDTPQNEPTYRARFYFDPNGFDPGTDPQPDPDSDDEMTLFFAASDNPVRRLVSILLNRSELDDSYCLVARARRDDTSSVDSIPIGITDAPHVVELEWVKATAPGANDGSLRLWVDPIDASTPPTTVLAGVDNDLYGVEFARLGAMGVNSDASGTLYLDGFVSRRSGFIGP